MPACPDLKIRTDCDGQHRLASRPRHHNTTCQRTNTVTFVSGEKTNVRVNDHRLIAFNMASSSTPSPIPDRPTSPELPLTMSASVVLTSLPKDATAALASAGTFSKDKIVVKFIPVGSAPQMARDVGKIKSSQKFEAVVAYLRRCLGTRDSDSVFLYVNSCFAPSLDEIVGNLHQVCWTCHFNPSISCPWLTCT